MGFNKLKKSAHKKKIVFLTVSAKKKKRKRKKEKQLEKGKNQMANQIG